MANYYEQCTREVTDVDLVGLGFGETPTGEKRYCVSIQGKKINEGLDPWFDEEPRWVSMTPECAKELYGLLAMYFGKKDETTNGE